MEYNLLPPCLDFRVVKNDAGAGPTCRGDGDIDDNLFANNASALVGVGG